MSLMDQLKPIENAQISDTDQVTIFSDDGKATECMIIGQLGTILWLLDHEAKLVHKGDLEKLLTHCSQGGHWLAAPRERIPFQQILNSSIFRDDGLPNDSFFRPARLEQRTKMVNTVRTYQLIS